MLSPSGQGRGALAALLGRSPSTEILWGLERIQRIVSALGEPHRSFESILIAGTNGKGSTAAIAESLLRAHGEKTGLYTSPHLVHPTERVRIDGRTVELELLDACAAEVLPLATRHGATFFESLTATAFLAFARSAVGVAVVEVGLGGRLDATNILEPLACAITTIGYDHSDYLGDTLDEIAREKAGIIKAGTPIVTGPLPPEPARAIARRAAQMNAAMIACGRDFLVEDVITDAGSTRFTYRAASELDGERFAVPLPGAHQAVNAAIALRVVEAAGRPLDPEASRSALGDVRWPGRFQVLATAEGTVVLDVAHNPDGARSLASALEAIPLPEPIVGLIGILGDKPWQEMLEPLLRHTSAAVFTVPPSAPDSRHWDPARARDVVQADRVEVIIDFDRALERARELARGGTVLVTGSSHTVGDALRRLTPIAGGGPDGSAPLPDTNQIAPEEGVDAIQS